MGAIIIGAIGGVIGWGVKRLTESTFSAVVCTGIFIAVMTLLPFSIELPDSMYQLLTNGTVTKMFGTIGYLVPMRDILTCVCFIILCRYSGLLFSLAIKLFNWISKIVGSSQ